MEPELAYEAVSMERGEEQSLQKTFLGEDVSVRVASSGPRVEFLTRDAFLGTFDGKVCTKANIDTLASFSFFSEQIFKQLKQKDRVEKICSYTSQYFGFECAVGEKNSQSTCHICSD